MKHHQEPKHDPRHERKSETDFGEIVHAVSPRGRSAPTSRTLSASERNPTTMGVPRQDPKPAALYLGWPFGPYRLRPPFGGPLKAPRNHRQEVVAVDGLRQIVVAPCV
jgi:hypothetical protein